MNSTNSAVLHSQGYFLLLLLCALTPSPFLSFNLLLTGLPVLFCLSVKSKPESEHLPWASLKGGDCFGPEEIGPCLVRQQKDFN